MSSSKGYSEVPQEESKGLDIENAPAPVKLEQTKPKRASEQYKKRKWYDAYEKEIKVFVYGIVNIAYWLVVLVYEEASINEPAGYYWGIFTATFLYVLVTLSYYNCSNNLSPQPTYWIPPYMDKFEMCKKCENRWKPTRTHHCSSCNECIMRMDHHCPWICNCVGYRNHKSFFYFCFYLTIGASVYVYNFSVYFYQAYQDETLFDFSWIFVTFCTICTLIIIPAGGWVLSLALYHFMLALNNLTTLEGMGGVKFKYPFEPESTRAKREYNKYDKGLLVNFCEFMGNTPFLFWYPTVPQDNLGGQIFLLMPELSPLEKIEAESGVPFEENQQEMAKRPKALEDINLDEIFKQAEEHTADKHIQTLTGMLEVGKRQDNTEGKIDKVTVYYPFPVQNGQKVENISEIQKKDEKELEPWQKPSFWEPPKGYHDEKKKKEKPLPVLEEANGYKSVISQPNVGPIVFPKVEDYKLKEGEEIKGRDGKAEQYHSYGFKGGVDFDEKDNEDQGEKKEKVKDDEKNAGEGKDEQDNKNETEEKAQEKDEETTNEASN